MTPQKETKTHLTAIAVTIQLPSSPESGLNTQSTDMLHELLAPDVRLPAQGITMLYGTGRSGKLRQYLVQKSVAGDLVYRETHPRIEIGRDQRSKLTLEAAADQGFLPIPHRLRASTMDDINQRWNRYLTEEGKPSERFPRTMSTNMHLLDRLVQESPYDQMAAISYQVRTVAGPTQLLTVFKPEAVQPDPQHPNRTIPRSGVQLETPKRTVGREYFAEQ